MDILILILVLIAITIILVFIHELGHFLLAKSAGVYVGEFAIGFGPKLFSFRYKETVYSLRWILLGGYVSILNKEILEGLEKAKAELQKDPSLKPQIEKSIRPYSLDKDYSEMKIFEQSNYTKRSLIILAGVFFNLVFSFLILFGSYSITGKKVNTNSVYINVIPTTNSQNGINNIPSPAAVFIDDALVNDYFDSIGADKSQIENYVFPQQLVSPLRSSFIHFVYVSDTAEKLEEQTLEYDSLLNNDNSDPYDKVYNKCQLDTNCYYGFSQILDFIKEPLNSTNLADKYIKIYFSQNFYITGLGANNQITNFSFQNVQDPNSQETSPTYIGFLNYAYQNASSSLVTDLSSQLNLFNNQIRDPNTRRSSYWYSFEFKVDTVKIINYLPAQIPISNVSMLSFVSKDQNGNDVFYNIQEYANYSAGDSFVAALEDTFVYMVVPYKSLFVVPDPNILLLSEEQFNNQSAINYASFNIALATLSSMLIFFNLLPIPPLDGYKFYEMTYEKLSKKEISTELKAKLNKIGWISIMVITVVLIIVPFIIYA